MVCLALVSSLSSLLFFLQVGRRSTGSHKAGPPGSSPGPATGGKTKDERAETRASNGVSGSRLCSLVSRLSRPSTQTGKAARSRAWCLWVRLPLRSLRVGGLGSGVGSQQEVLRTSTSGSRLPTPVSRLIGRQPNTVGRAALLMRFSFTGDEGSNPSPSAGGREAISRQLSAVSQRSLPSG